MLASGPFSPIGSTNIRNRVYIYTLNLMGELSHGSGDMFIMYDQNGIKKSIDIYPSHICR